MKIPDNIRVNGVDYTVKEVPIAEIISDDRLCLGMVDHDQCVVRVTNDRECYQKRCITLWHELMHIVFEQAQLELGADEEKIVECAARGVYQILQDNGAVLFDLVPPDRPRTRTQEFKYDGVVYSRITTNLDTGEVIENKTP